MISLLTMAKERTSTPGDMYEAAFQLDSSERPMPSRTTSQSFSRTLAPLTYEARSWETLEKSSRVEVAPEGKHWTRPSSTSARRVSSDLTHEDTNRRNSSNVMSFNAAVVFATSATWVSAFKDAR